jgi:hypothetical protein
VIEPASASGIFVEVRGADGTVLHRRTINNAIATSGEIFNPDGTIERVDLAGPPTGRFDVVVPDVDAADHAVILASEDCLPPTLRAAVGPGQRVQDALAHESGPGARPIATLPLRSPDHGNR